MIERPVMRSGEGPWHGRSRKATKSDQIFEGWCWLRPATGEDTCDLTVRKVSFDWVSERISPVALNDHSANSRCYDRKGRRKLDYLRDLKGRSRARTEAEMNRCGVSGACAWVLCRIGDGCRCRVQVLRVTR